MSDSVGSLPGRLGEALVETLREGEVIVDALHTSSGQAIAATDRRVIILKAGLAAGAGMFGSKAVSYPYDTITSIEHKKGPIGGHIEILAAGVHQSGPMGVYQVNAVRENVVTYVRRDLRTSVVRIITLIQERVDGARNAKMGPSPIGGDRLADQIAKLHALKEQGALTEDEFISAKAKLLGTT